MTRVLPLLCAALLLSGCPGMGIGPQPGLSSLEVTAPDGLALEFESGKEYGSIEGTYTKPDGTVVTFKATQVEAFAGQLILAEMQARQIDALSDMVDLMKSLAAAYASGGLVPPKPPAPVTP